MHLTALTTANFEDHKVFPLFCVLVQWWSSYKVKRQYWLNITTLPFIITYYYFLNKLISKFQQGITRKLQKKNLYYRYAFHFFLGPQILFLKNSAILTWTSGHHSQDHIKPRLSWSCWATFKWKDKKALREKEKWPQASRRQKWRECLPWLW